MITAAYVAAVLAGLVILCLAAIAVCMWRIRRAEAAARLRGRLWDIGMEIEADRDAKVAAMEPIGYQTLHEAHHSIGQTVDRYRRGVITADEAIAAIHEQVGDETDRTAERDAEMETR